MKRSRSAASAPDVGPSKSVGYLTLQTIKDFAQVERETLASAARTRGLLAVSFEPSACCIKSGALKEYRREPLATCPQAHTVAISDAELERALRR